MMIKAARRLPSSQHKRSLVARSNACEAERVVRTWLARLEEPYAGAS